MLLIGIASVPIWAEARAAELNQHGVGVGVTVVPVECEHHAEMILSSELINASWPLVGLVLVGKGFVRDWSCSP
jgi:hypothetical protein